MALFKQGLFCLFFIFQATVALADLKQTKDAFIGLENPSIQRWAEWHAEMLRARQKARDQINFDPQIYQNSNAEWSDSSFRQFKVFIYDQRFFRDGRYHTQELIDHINHAFGGADSVLLWHAYPRVGFDTRTQFDFYRDMPGGLNALRTEVIDIFHANGIRVFVNYNPWDVGGDDNPDVDSPAYQASYKELASTIAAVNADGIMLDTLNSVPKSLRQILNDAKPGVVLAPERRATDSDLNWARQSWAQWYELGDNQPSVYRHKWFVPQHQQYATRRWDSDRHGDIVYSFFNGSGLLIWDNIYGSWNPYSLKDRVLLAQTRSVLKSFGSLFTKGTWLPLIPSGSKGLDVNYFANDEIKVFTFRNRTGASLYFKKPEIQNLKSVVFWNEPNPKPGFIEVTAFGTQAIALAPDETLTSAKQSFLDATKNAENAVYDSTQTPRPWLVTKLPYFLTKPLDSNRMRFIPGASFTMNVAHPRRESGCYSHGATENALWGWFYEDVIQHSIQTTVQPFFIKTTAVTNAEFLDFVHNAKYQPQSPENFLKHILRTSDGTLPTKLFSPQADLPVTYVSLNDARAYANWKGERLPTEEEWQWAAEGAGQGNKWPWGNNDSGSSDENTVNLTGAITPAHAYAKAATPQGVLQLTGNIWEMTESEWTDGHNRFLMLRGGVYLPKAQSLWVIPRGPRPNQFHAKYLLMDDSLDRSESVGFRTVR